MYDLSFDPQQLAKLQMGSQPGGFGFLTGGGFMDPKTQGLLGAAGALLAASGPSTTPQGFGQIAGKGLLGGTQAFQQARQGQMQELQGGLLIAQLKKQLEGMDALKRFTSSQAGPATEAPAAAAAGGTGLSDASAGAVGAPWAAASALPQPAPTHQQPTPPGVPDFGALAANGVDPKVIDVLIKDWELRNPQKQVHGGYAYDARKIPSGFIPQVNVSQNGQATGIMPSQNGGLPSVSALPGSLSTFSQFKDSEERAKANYEPVMSVMDSQGRPLPMTRTSFADRYGPRPVSAAGTPEAVGGGPGVGVGPTPAQRISAETMGKNDAERVSALEQKLPSQMSTLRRLDRMEALTKDDQTFAAKGAELKKELGSLAQAFGLKIDPSKTANTETYLAQVGELLKDRLGSKDYGSGSGVSNLDLISASGPLPELAKTAQGRLQIIQAIRADTQRNISDAQSARDYFDSNRGSLRGFKYPSEIEAEKAGLTKNLKDVAKDGVPQPSKKNLRYNPATGKIE